MNTHMTQQDQIGLGRSITWICPPCSVHHVHRVQCPPRQRPRVGEVAWLRGEEKDEAEEEEEGMGEVSWLRGGRKRWHRRRTNFWHGRTKTTTTGTEGILRGPKKYFEQRHCLNKGIVPM